MATASAGRDVHSCARLKESGEALRGRTLSLYQEPLTAACAYDLFVWVPASKRPAADDHHHGCGGDLGIRAGSSAINGYGGLVVLDDRCSGEPPRTPPPSETTAAPRTREAPPVGDAVVRDDGWYYDGSTGDLEPWEAPVTPHDGSLSGAEWYHWVSLIGVAVGVAVVAIAGLVYYQRRRRLKAPPSPYVADAGKASPACYDCKTREHV